MFYFQGENETSIVWHLKTPKDWNVQKLKAVITDRKFDSDPFTIEMVRQGSLIMKTKVPTSVLKNAEFFDSQVKSLLLRMFQACDIDTNVPCNIDVSLQIEHDNDGKLFYLGHKSFMRRWKRK